MAEKITGDEIWRQKGKEEQWDAEETQGEEGG